MKRWYYCICVLFVMMLGCDLANYQERMDRQIARLQKWDEEQASLGSPLLIPGPVQEGQATSVTNYRIFYRPPAYISSTVKLDEYPWGPGKLVFRYPGKDNYNLFLARKPLPNATTPNQGTNQQLQQPDEPPRGNTTKNGKDKKRELTFLQKVAAGLQDFYVAEYKHKPKTVQFFFPDPDDSLVAIEPFQMDDPPLPTLKFQLGLMEVREKTIPNVQFRLYHFAKEKETKEVVIVFQIPLEKANDEETLKLIHRSLKTFVMGPRSHKRRVLYNRAYR